MARHFLFVSSLVTIALLAACGPDWDALDPSLGVEQGSGGAGTGGAGIGGAGIGGAGTGDPCAILDDNNPCTDDACVGGAPQHTPVATGTACSASGGVVCNAAGACVECIKPADCPGVDDECQTRGCSAAGACEPSFTPKNTTVSAQTKGDCQEAICDGAGGLTSRDDNTDLPDDGQQCTIDDCFKGSPRFNDVGSGTACDQNGGKICDGAGACVECTKASDCGVSTSCVTYTCANSMCNPPAFAGVGTFCGGLSKCDGLGTCVACSTPATSTFNAANLPMAVPNGDAMGIVSTLSAAGLGGSIVDVNVTLNISSDTSGDLDVALISPSGTAIDLTSGNGASNDNNFAGTTFDDDANAPRVTKAALADNVPLTLAIPERNLGLLTGENPNGTWSLRVKDLGAEGAGSTLNSWSLSITAQTGNYPLNPAMFSNNNAMPTIDGAEISSAISVAGVTGDIYRATVAINLAHAWSEQLVVSLTSPAGKVIQLLNGDGGTSSNVFTGTTFSDAAPLLIGCSGAGCVSFVSGVVVPMAIPEGSLSALIGDTPNGVWTLKVLDTTVGDGGTLNSWSIAITPSLCAL